MPALALILFDDAVAGEWEPFALTRPLGELLFGVLTLRERAERALGLPCVAYLGAAHLAGFSEEGSPPLLSLDDTPRQSPQLFLCSRAVPAWDQTSVVAAWEPGPVSMGGEIVGWFTPRTDSFPPPSFFRDPGKAGPTPAGNRLAGRVLHRVWDLVSANPDQIASDIHALFPSPPPAQLPSGVHRLGEGPVVLGEGVRIEPGVVLDTTNGPIWLDAQSSVRAFARVAGPTYIGRRSTVLGGPVEAVSVGPVCKVRGELAESVCLGYVNKAHEGHIGHAYLGRWVNLGAGTTNSDLKNNYGTVRVWTPKGEADTGLIKLGCLLGDHVKTGIGLLLNTGTVVGAGSNLYGAAMPPKYVPPFSWGTGENLVPYRVDKFLEVAGAAMARRNVELSAEMRTQLAAAAERGASSMGEARADHPSR